MTDFPVIILITADNCHACGRFKSSLLAKGKNHLGERISATNKFQFKHLNLKSMSKTDKEDRDIVNANPEVFKIISWYPSIVMLDADNRVTKTGLKHRLFKGIFNTNDNVYQYDNTATYAQDINGILGWINSSAPYTYFNTPSEGAGGAGDVPTSSIVTRSATTPGAGGEGKRNNYVVTAGETLVLPGYEPTALCKKMNIRAKNTGAR